MRDFAHDVARRKQPFRTPSLLVALLAPCTLVYMTYISLNHYHSEKAGPQHELRTPYRKNPVEIDHGGSSVVSQAAETGTGIAGGNESSPPPLAVVARTDLPCNDLRSKGGSAAEVWSCRRQTAKQLAVEACAELQRTPPSPQFRAANLSLSIAESKTGRRGAEHTVRIFVEPYGDIVSDQIISNGVWEGQEVQSIIWSLADAERQGIKDPVLLDIGANLGVFALTAAALGYEVIAFEAMERNQKAMYSSLCASPALQERITLFPFALGAEEATCSVISDKANVADGHVACAESTRQSLLMEGYVERGKMHVVTLGDYMDGVDVHVLKMDVEGFEANIIMGAGKFLGGSLLHSVSEVGTSALLRQNPNMTFAEIAAIYPGRFLDAGFEFHDGASWGDVQPTNRSDTSWISRLQEAIGVHQVNVFLSRPRKTSFRRTRVHLSLRDF